MMLSSSYQPVSDTIPFPLPHKGNCQFIVGEIALFLENLSLIYCYIETAEKRVHEEKIRSEKNMRAL